MNTFTIIIETETSCHMLNHKGTYIAIKNLCKVSNDVTSDVFLNLVSPDPVPKIDATPIDFINRRTKLQTEAVSELLIKIFSQVTTTANIGDYDIHLNFMLSNESIKSDMSVGTISVFNPLKSTTKYGFVVNNRKKLRDNKLSTLEDLCLTYAEVMTSLKTCVSDWCFNWVVDSLYEFDNTNREICCLFLHKTNTQYATSFYNTRFELCDTCSGMYRDNRYAFLISIANNLTADPSIIIANGAFYQTGFYKGRLLEMCAELNNLISDDYISQRDIFNIFIYQSVMLSDLEEFQTHPEFNPATLHMEQK